MALDLSGSIQMSQDFKQFLQNNNKFERHSLLIDYSYTFDSGNNDNYPPLPDGADPLNHPFYAFQSLSGIDSDTYNLNSITGSFFGKQAVLNFDTIYVLGIFSTGNLVVSGNINTIPSPFGHTTGETIGIEHNLPFLIQNNQSGWNANYVSDFSIQQKNDDGVVDYALCVLGYIPR